MGGKGPSPPAGTTSTGSFNSASPSARSHQQKRLRWLLEEAASLSFRSRWPTEAASSPLPPVPVVQGPHCRSVGALGQCPAVAEPTLPA